MIKQVRFKTIGMQKDSSESAFDSQFAFHNYNVRITPSEDNTLFSIVNEKGNKEVLKGLIGCPIGQANVNDVWVIFTTEIIIPVGNTTHDRIYKIWEDDSTLKYELLFNGDLNFNVDNPIETLVSIENLDVQKVYWVDGINQPRVINIATPEENRQSWTNTSFDISTVLNFRNEIEITRKSTGGSFHSGVIQYAFTYYKIYGQESNIFYTSPLYYISNDNRGASPEDVVSNSFDITIKEKENEYANKGATPFDYVRIYSIHRSSINATPEVRRVVDLKVSNNIQYTDNGVTGDIVDPTELLYIGGEEIIAGTINQKDSTLFLGDITLKRKEIPEDVRKSLGGESKPAITFSNSIRSLYPGATGNYYPYKNQLNCNSSQIKTFKYLETYRFGIQAQHKNGKWSEPIWIDDVTNTIPINTTLWDEGKIEIPTAECTIPSSVLTSLVNEDYLRIRPVVVFPTLQDRDVICQGVVCPTVYNVGDRADNSPFVQSSWFIRPNAPFDINNTTNKNTLPLGKDYGESIYSKGGISSTSIYNEQDEKIASTFDKGVPLEFRHNYPIPGNNKAGAEIQCIYDPPEDLNIPNNADINSWISDNKHNFYVDQSIVTLHSPDIEFDETIKSLDLSNVKFRITGAVPITSFTSDVDIQTSSITTPFKGTTEYPQGFYKGSVKVPTLFSSGSGDNIKYGDSHFGFRSLSAAPFWMDEVFKRSDSNVNKWLTGFVVYPWHRNGSLNNGASISGEARPSMLARKKMSNLKTSYKTYYFEHQELVDIGISGAKLFNSNEIISLRIPAPLNSEIGDINYYGNIDKIITNNDYPIIISGSNTNNVNDLFTDTRIQLSSSITSYYQSSDPVRIKYKSSPHIVMAFNYTDDGKVTILPTIDTVNKLASNESIRAFWGNIKGINQAEVAINESPIFDTKTTGFQHGYLWLGELYRDTVVNKFGGQTEEAFSNNQWIPCGEPVNIYTRRIQDGLMLPKDSVNVQWTEGDTYFQRYDHLKTYPSTLEDQNSMTEIVSFMCETRVNIDGRYDKNRGLENNLATTPENFNKINSVYSQPNNFFNYRGLDYKLLSVDHFPHTITWTKSKSAGELIDTWTNITLASTLDLEGNLGPIRSIKNFNNNLIAFQDKSISQILYNENTQISTTEGVPIEIANSGKVSGRRYITNSIGCKNKWSICETPYGLYFIDSINKGIYIFNGEIKDLTTTLGFSSWAKKSIDDTIWNPYTFNGFVTYYDPINKDVLFTSKDQCLAYSEIIGQFTSFYSYEKTPYITKLGNKVLSILSSNSRKDAAIYSMHEGDYNYFYHTDDIGNIKLSYYPFSTTVIVNPDPYKDKIFNNVEFRADSWDSDGKLLNTTLDKLEVWNEYQHGEVDLIFNRNVPSSLKKKFRTWRVNIPRDDSNGRDRIRNPWTYIKLSSELENTYKTILHDMVVTYYE